MAQDNNPSTEIARKSLLDDDRMSEIKSLDDAFKALEGVGAEVESFEDYGNGFSVLPTDEKMTLIKQPFMILEWRFTTGDNGEFVSAALVTKDNRRLILNDGSTGIRDQLRKVTEKREAKRHATPYAGLLVPGGLRVSEYDYEDEKTGETKRAKTFYLAN